jgi:3D (Asp-Asp-Asp) domain-containing protein
MRKYFVSDKPEDFPLVVPILAIISIITQLMFPQYTIIAKTNNNIKTNLSQNNNNIEKPKATEELALTNQENKIKEGPKTEEEIKQEIKQEGKVLAVQIEASKKQPEKILAVQTEHIENISINKDEIENNQVASDAPFEKETVKNKKLVLVTAYSSTVDQTDSTPFITASGTYVHDGTIAANFLKFGTKVKFPSLYGDKIFTVEDRMKSNYKVDIWFPTRQEAKNFGVKRIEMEIL